MKKEIFDLLIEKHKGNITDLEQSIASHREAADIDENETKDMDDLSQQDQTNEIITALIDQLDKARTELEELTSYRKFNNDSFSIGALVETKDHFLVVGPSVGMTKHNGKDVICVSDGSRVFEENEGKGINESLKLGEKVYEILNIS